MKKIHKQNEPDPAELKAREFLDRSLKFVKKESKRLIKWLFFFQPKSKFMATTHIIDILAIFYITYRIMNA